MSENPMELLASSPKELIIKTCGGNPGALQVLMQVVNKFGAEINPLCIAMLMTNSDAPSLWLLFKEQWDHQIEPTMDILRTWYDSSTDSLENWGKAQGFKCFQ